MKSKNFYITTTAPYVNASPHLGFALEIIQADVIARYHRILGDDVFFNTGTDEHGKKIYEKALKSKVEPQTYVNEYATKYNGLKKALNLSYDSFQRTTNTNHIEAAQEIWKRVDEAGYIEKGIYKAKYCVGCELEKQDSDLINDICPLHPNKEIEFIEEENYFFKFSKLQKKLLEYYDNNPEFIVPNHRQKEIRNFVHTGLSDFSVSRLKEKMPWGISVPGDDRHVMFVWFDALTYYISALGWPKNDKKFRKYWGTKENPNAIQTAGKDNLRQQSAMWQAILFAAGLPPTKQILIHGFITSGGQKMSKSLGNVIDPFEYVEKYGTDALRYYLLAKVNPTEDSDFTKEKFIETYNADLANGLGNLVSRIAKLCEKINFQLHTGEYGISDDSTSYVENYEFDKAIASLWNRIKNLDININKVEPWKLLAEKKYDLLSLFLLKSCKEILEIAYFLKPLLPETSQKITDQFLAKEIKSTDPLFPRIK